MRNPIIETAQIVRLLETLPVILAKGILAITDLTAAIDRATTAFATLAEQLADVDQS